jgi:hypothetical protein
LTEPTPGTPARRRPSPGPRPAAVPLRPPPVEMPTPVVEPTVDEPVVDDSAVVEPSVVDSSVVDTSVVDSSVVEPSVVDSPVDEAPSVEVAEAEPRRARHSRVDHQPRTRVRAPKQESRSSLGLRPRVIIAAIAAVIVVAVVIALVIGKKSPTTSSAQRSALASAKTAVVHLESYDYRTFAADLAAALPLATPNFRAFFAGSATDVTEPTAVQASEVVRTTVVATSLVKSGTTSYVFLITTKQVTTHAGKPYADEQERDDVTMQLVNKHWLLSNLVPV